MIRSLPVLFLIIMCLTIGVHSETKEIAPQIIQKAAAIHERVMTVDTHVDTPFMLERDDFAIDTFNDPHKGGGKVDFPRMKKGGLDAIFFAVFVGQEERSQAGNENAKNEALATFALIHQAIKAHSGLVELALTPDDAYKIEKRGKRAIYIGMENGYPLGKDIGLVKKFYDLDARYITLCHTQNNDICDSATDRKGPEHNGLTNFGKEVVKEMNRLGMLIDVSHISDKSFYDVLELSAAPVVATHSCAREVCDNPRNLTDDMLKKLAQKGGVVQLCILSDYIKKMPVNPEYEAARQALRGKRRSDLSDAEKKKIREEWHKLQEKYPPNLASVTDAVDHIDHMVKVMGIDYVGIGTDFDGGGGLKDCFDVSEMGNITLELVKRGYSEEDIRKIWGGNFMRVFREVERVARETREKHENILKA